jgi:dihydroorotate dehydrogenase electron transfer subunit
VNMGGEFEARKITAISKINLTTSWLIFEGDISAQPGQFVMVWLPKIGEKPFSIAEIDPFGLLVVDVGPFSHALQQLEEGDQVWIKGPLGRGFSIVGERMLLVGGGYGSAPLLALARVARAQNKLVDVCLGARGESGLLLSDAFSDLGCHVSYATEDGSLGWHGLVTGIVEQNIQRLNYDLLCACGPTGMLSALADLCKTHRLDYQFSWEAHMRCGMGLCGSCEVSQSLDESLPIGWLACFDGPVFHQQFGD